MDEWTRVQSSKGILNHRLIAEPLAETLGREPQEEPLPTAGTVVDFRLQQQITLARR